MQILIAATLHTKKEGRIAAPFFEGNRTPGFGPLPLLPFGPGGVHGELAVRLPRDKKWRRGEDSNLRYPLGYTHFPGVLLRPTRTPLREVDQLIRNMLAGKQNLLSTALLAPDSSG